MAQGPPAGAGKAFPVERCVAVIPCLNEGATIARVVAGVRTHLDRVLVVDDGSADRTREEAAAAGAAVLRHDAPRGKGAALAAAWTRAREEGFSWALCLDGDGQHSPHDIPRFLEAAGMPAALVVGNRMTSTSAMPPLRRLVNRWMSRRLSQLAGQELPDTQCGFRLMSLEAWSRLTLHASHFEVESEVLVEFVRAGERVVFVPIEVIYKSEQSKIHPVRDTVRWFRWLRANACRRGTKRIQ